MANEQERHDSHDGREQARAPEHPEQKQAATPVPIDEDIRNRWSPRAFADRPVSEEDLTVLLEAARWAPSSYNEQPWRFVVARREDEEAFEKLLGCLNEANQEWAQSAPVLMMTFASTRFERNGRPNRHGYHDVGLAMGTLIQQAMSLDLYVHQMAGVDAEATRGAYDVPDEFDVVAGVAIGYLGDPSDLEDPGRRRAETSERARRPLEEIVFEGTWGRPARFVGTDAAGVAS